MPEAQAALPAEIFHVRERTVACDGGDGPLGHPRVFLHIKGDEITCPYCSRRFVLEAGAGADSGH